MNLLDGLGVIGELRELREWDLEGKVVVMGRVVVKVLQSSLG